MFLETGLANHGSKAFSDQIEISIKFNSVCTRLSSELLDFSIVFEDVELSNINFWHFQPPCQTNF